MPVLRIMADQFGEQPKANKRDQKKRIVLEEPSEVSLEGVVVTVIEDSSVTPMAREVRDARERAVGALASGGAEIRTVRMPAWKRSLIPFLSSLHDTEEQKGGVLQMLRETTDPGDEPADVARPQLGSHVCDQDDSAC